MSTTSIDHCYGLRRSLKKRNESRMILSYETKKSARERFHTNKQSETNKKHTVNYDVGWDKKRLLDEVQKNIKENKLINWSEIGSRFEINNKNNELAKN